MFKYAKHLAALALTALLCLPMAAYAETEKTIGNYDEDGYKVTIPAEVSLPEYDGIGSEVSSTLTVSAELGKYRTLDITIASENGWKLYYTDENGNKSTNAGTPKLGYGLTCTDGNTLGEDTDSFPVKKTLQFKTDAGAKDDFSAELNVKLTNPTDATMSGSYQDKLVFTVSCTRETYTLTFDTNAAGDSSVSETPDDKKVTPGEPYGDLPTPTRDYYTFTGWYTDDTYDTNEVTKDDMVPGTESKTIKVYAQWRANVLRIKYHNDGAEKILWQSGLWSSRPHLALTEGAHTYDGAEYITVNGEDVILWQEERYGEKYTNNTNGLYDVSRWKRTGYTAKANTWQWNGLEYTDGDRNFTNGEDCALWFNVLSEFKKGDVTIDLHPIWTVAQSLVESDADTSYDDIFEDDTTIIDDVILPDTTDKTTGTKDTVEDTDVKDPEPAEDEDTTETVDTADTVDDPTEDADEASTDLWEEPDDLDAELYADLWESA